MAYLIMTSGSTSMSYNNNYDNKKYKGVKMTKQIKDIKEMDNGKI